MNVQTKISGATNTARSLLNKQKTYESEYTLMLSAIQEIREACWHLSIKYRWDPTVSKIHAEYLTMLNNLLRKSE